MKAVLAALFAGMVCYAFVQPVLATNAVAYKERVLYSFSAGSDGAEPYAGVIDVNGVLYGSTFFGGDSDNGTVFSLDLSTAAEKVLHMFGNCEQGPSASVIDVKGKLYGTTTGGDCGVGITFSVDPNTGTEKTLYTFGANGEYPHGRLIYINGLLYGTTGGGGRRNCSSGCGTVFSLDRKTGAEKVLYLFCAQQNCADGSNPRAGIIDVNGTLYGTTNAGGGAGCGGAGCGTVFSFDPTTGTETVLYSFCSQPNCADGANPVAGLIDVNGTLYGTTAGGANTGCSGGCGTVFSIDPNTGAENTLYSFCSRQDCADGGSPLAGLVDVNGVLYGTTFEGGSTTCTGGGCGTVFSLDPGTGLETVLYSFCSQPNCADGSNPAYVDLISVKGALYGTTAVGGTGTECGSLGCGTVFELKKKR